MERSMGVKSALFLLPIFLCACGYSREEKSICRKSRGRAGKMP